MTKITVYDLFGNGHCIECRAETKGDIIAKIIAKKAHPDMDLEEDFCNIKRQLVHLSVFGTREEVKDTIGSVNNWEKQRYTLTL